MNLACVWWRLWWRVHVVGLWITLSALPERLERFLPWLAITFALYTLVDGYILRYARAIAGNCDHTCCMHWADVVVGIQGLSSLLLLSDLTQLTAGSHPPLQHVVLSAAAHARHAHCLFGMALSRGGRGVCTLGL